MLQLARCKPYCLQMSQFPCKHLGHLYLLLLLRLLLRNFATVFWESTIKQLPVTGGAKTFTAYYRHSSKVWQMNRKQNYHSNQNYYCLSVILIELGSAQVPTPRTHWAAFLMMPLISWGLLPSCLFLHAGLSWQCLSSLSIANLVLSCILDPPRSIVLAVTYTGGPSISHDQSHSLLSLSMFRLLLSSLCPDYLHLLPCLSTTFESHNSKKRGRSFTVIKSYAAHFLTESTPDQAFTYSEQFDHLQQSVQCAHRMSKNT